MMELVQGMPDSEYRNRAEISQSQFKAFCEPTPAHAKYALAQKIESENMINGTCLHALVLEKKKVYIVDSKCKTQKNPAQPENGIVLSPHNAAIVEGMAAGIKRNAGAKAIIEALTHREVSIFWNGMKARLDGVFPFGVIDLKSTKGADSRSFSKSIHEYGYHIQAAHYLEAAAVAGLPCDDFYVIASENFEPYECAVYRIGHQSLEIGQRELENIRKLYFDCLASDTYPGYPSEPQEINLPYWATKGEE